MIKLSNINKSYDGRAVLKDFSLEVAQGERVCLSGPSGCGKSTVLAIASGTLKPDSGEVIINENLRMAYLYQENRLLPWLNALENITVTGVSADKAMEMLGRLGLGADANKRPSELSGGMRRRLAIARALAYGGDVYFFDEPMQGLDDKTADTVMQVMLECVKDKTVLMVSHNDAEISALATRVVRLEPQGDAAQ